MTRDEIVSFAVGKLGITDATAREQAETFCKARWALIWDEEFWRQTRHQATVTVTAGTQDVELPTEFEFATACRWAGSYELQPITDSAAFALDPAGYDKAGPVVHFIPLGKNASGKAMLRLMRKPEQTQPLLVIGKRKCVQLENGTDSPTIPGASQVLCEFVLGDLLEWMRQFAKAQVCFARGGAMLTKMKEIETAQTAGVQRIIPTEQVHDDEGTGWLT